MNSRASNLVSIDARFGLSWYETRAFPTVPSSAPVTMSIQQLGPYQIHEVIGRGGMGTVYLGVEQGSGQRVAVKVLSPALGHDESFRARFEAEIQSLEQVKHPGIVELYGFGQEDDHLFFAMELVDGRSLQGELAAGRRFDWREVVKHAVEMCSALKHAHDHGIVHRDIKPANLLLTSTEPERIKLTDFGIAKFFGNTDLTARGGILGTADFMAPEQAEGLGATPRSDLYSLGAVLYALLAGRPPFQGKSLAEVVHKVRFDQPLPVGRFNADCPVALEEIIAQLLEKSPEQRVATPLALSKRLTAILETHSVSNIARPTPPVVQALDSAIQPSPDQETLVPTRGPESSLQQFDREEDALRLSQLPTSAHESPSEADETPNQAKPSKHFTSVDEAYRKSLRESKTVPESKLVFFARLLALLATVAFLILIASYLLRTPSADEIFADINDAVERDALLSAEGDLKHFLLAHHDDPRADTVRRFLDDINLIKLERRLTNSRSTLTQDASSIEQLLVEALLLEESSPSIAEKKLLGLIAVYADSEELTPTDAQCIEVARRRVEKLTEQLENHNELHREAIIPRLQHAEKLAASDLAAACEIWRGVITLYGDKPWARDYVEQARQALEERCTQ